MRFSGPIYQLKRRARLLARDKKIALHEALDRIARQEGFAGWSQLALQFAMNSRSKEILSRLANGDLLLLGARPGHGKTSLGLRLLLDAVREGRRAVFFTLEYSEQETRERIRSLDFDAQYPGDDLEIVTSDDISADYIIRHLSGSDPGTVAVIDYLQILDQKRSKPALCDQMLALGEFARNAGTVLAFISQIDRTFDPASKRLPDIRDIRLPNFVDLKLFTKACFLHGHQTRLQDVV
jgi:replicative DNA helicase